MKFKLAPSVSKKATTISQPSQQQQAAPATRKPSLLGAFRPPAKPNTTNPMPEPRQERQEENTTTKPSTDDDLQTNSRTASNAATNNLMMMVDGGTRQPQEEDGKEASAQDLSPAINPSSSHDDEDIVFQDEEEDAFDYRSVEDIPLIPSSNDHTQHKTNASTLLVPSLTTAATVDATAAEAPMNLKPKPADPTAKAKSPMEMFRIAEITVDHDAVPPSPMRDPSVCGAQKYQQHPEDLLDSYATTRWPGTDASPPRWTPPKRLDPTNTHSHSPSHHRNQDMTTVMTQLWDAQRLVRIILGKRVSTPVGSGHQPSLDSSMILEAIKVFALMKQELNTLRSKQATDDKDPPAILTDLVSPASQSTATSTSPTGLSHNAKKQPRAFFGDADEERARMMNKSRSMSSIQPEQDTNFHTREAKVALQAIIEASRKISGLEYDLKQAHNTIDNLKKSQGLPASSQENRTAASNKSAAMLLWRIQKLEKENKLLREQQANSSPTKPTMTTQSSSELISTTSVVSPPVKSSPEQESTRELSPSTATASPASQFFSLPGSPTLVASSALSNPASVTSSKGKENLASSTEERQQEGLDENDAASLLKQLNKVRQELHEKEQRIAKMEAAAGQTAFHSDEGLLKQHHPLTEQHHNHHKSSQLQQEADNQALVASIKQVLLEEMKLGT